MKFVCISWGSGIGIAYPGRLHKRMSFGRCRYKIARPGTKGKGLVDDGVHIQPMIIAFGH